MKNKDFIKLVNSIIDNSLIIRAKQIIKIFYKKDDMQELIDSYNEYDVYLHGNGK